MVLGVPVLGHFGVGHVMVLTVVCAQLANCFKGYCCHIGPTVL